MLEKFAKLRNKFEKVSEITESTMATEPSD